MAALVMSLGSGPLAIVIRFRRWCWTRTRRSRGYTRLTDGGRERVMNVYHKALRTLENKGYRGYNRTRHLVTTWLSWKRQPCTYLWPSVTLAVWLMPASTTLVRRTALLRRPASLTSRRCANCLTLAGEPEHPHIGAAFPSGARSYEPMSG